MALLKVLAVQAAILLAGLACVELVFRQFLPLPLHGGVYLDANGRSVRIALNQFVLRPNLDVTHAASEFSARIRTNALGYRWVDHASVTPQYLFLGDSFTFGHGVADEETFADRFCVENNLTCQNLGYSGSDTFDEVGILRYALDHYGMRPVNVVVVMLAACWLDAAGNDLGDNLRHYSKGAEHDRPWVRMLQSWFGGLELTKRAMLVLSQQIKGALYRCSDAGHIEAAITATKAALIELERLSVERHFNVRVVVIHPYSELDGRFARTEEAVRRATPAAFGLLFTGAEFRKGDYYPYDGHFNAAGHRKMAMILKRGLLNVGSQGKLDRTSRVRE